MLFFGSLRQRNVIDQETAATNVDLPCLRGGGGSSSGNSREKAEIKMPFFGSLRCFVLSHAEGMSVPATISHLHHNGYFDFDNQRHGPLDMDLLAKAVSALAFLWLVAEKDQQIDRRKQS